MSSDGFRTYGGSTTFGQDNRPDSIHIHIEDNEMRSSQLSNLPNIPNLDQMPSNSNPSSSIHSVLNRVRQHTIGSNIDHNSSEWRMNLSNNLRTLTLGYIDSTRLSSPQNPNSRSDRTNFHDNFLNHNEEQLILHDESNPQHDTIETRQPSRAFGTNNQGIEAFPPVPHARLDEDNNNNVFSDIFVRVLGNFVRYLPFLAILFIKLIHDHLLGILDIVLLQSVIYIVNKSVCNQVSKLSDKNMVVLLRDFSLITAAVTFRLLLTTSSPDLFGLILTPPTESMTIEISTSTLTKSSSSDEPSTLKLLSKFLHSLNQRESMELDAGNTVTTTKTISLGLLLYYVAVNDLFLKMLTILTKIFVTMLSNKLLRHKQRAHMYALIEYFSQFYRALVPTRQWIMFLFKSYTGLEVISGILLSAFYMGAKGFEFTSRGKVLHQAFTSFIRNMDYERKPTKDELEAAGLICPICHDTYNTPIILTCNHVFCDDCVSQWFKREQTCPMCRAKVSDDPHWQDGSTTFFYQFF